ncbi:MAG TPA: Uma2 family endonuclease [Chloroflexia bacterium]|nr:Uma2 family endonuclease [Chloroflexia bacterium]
MALTDIELEELLRAGAIKLEITGGIPTWEAWPGVRHQRMVQLIQNSIQPLSDDSKICGGNHFADVDIRFKDGSIKRPDISIFCAMPPIQDEILEIIPEGVVEVINPGFEFKDVFLNPQFYLAQGVDDVVVVDPRSGVVTHYRTTEVAIHQAPVTINLQCGCQCTIPQPGEIS